VTKTLIESLHHLQRQSISQAPALGSAMLRRKLLPNQRKVVAEVDAVVDEVALQVLKMVCH
jgi:hypothetical protein